MSDFGEIKHVVGRKRHRCMACWSFIPVKEKHHHCKGMYDGDWQNWRMHNECFESYKADGYGEFTPGDYPVPYRVKEMYGVAS